MQVTHNAQSVALNRYAKQAVSVALLLLANSVWSTTSARAQFVTRTVTVANGEFGNMSPRFGFEVGEGTSRVEWGQALPGSVTSFMRFDGYDAVPNFEQEWFFGGQTVMPEQSFRLGTLTFRNGSVATTSSAVDLSVDLDVSAFGGEFLVDSQPFLAEDTWRIQIRQTPNTGVDQVVDADYFYFPAFPSLGSFRVFEGKSTSVQVFARFGSLQPAAFGAVADPTAGVVVPSVVDNTGSIVWKESGEAGNLPSSAQMTIGNGSLTDVVGSLTNASDQDMFLIRITDPLAFSATTSNAQTTVVDTQLFLFGAGGLLVAQNDNDPLQAVTTSRVTPGSVPGSPDLYLLAVSSFNSDPVGSPISGWLPGGGSGQYRIALTGASFATVPEPSSIVLGWLAVVGLLVRRLIWRSGA